VLRYTLDTLNRLMGWTKRGRRIRIAGPVVKVNLGSALSVAPGWVNVDASLNALIAGAPAPVLKTAYRWSGSRVLYSREDYCRILGENRFLHVDFEHGLPFEDQSVDFLFSSHLLEHLYSDQAGHLLREIYRVLKIGGWARISVPDLEHAVRLYQQGERAKALGYFFSDSRIGALNRHQYMYDLALLRDAFERAGFSDVQRRVFRQGNVPDLDLLDNRPEESLYVEARRS
jgi:SAM-dependent methyltransferase